jgi:hypothetical protein
MKTLETLVRCILAFSLSLLVLGGNLSAAEPLLLKLEMKDGVLSPQRLEVPAGAPFRLEVKNVGKTPAEFECKPLKKEKTLPAGTTMVMDIKALSAGEYRFVDEFREKLPAAQGVIVAK